MTPTEVQEVLEQSLRIRQGLDCATEQLMFAESALRVASARLELLTRAVERAVNEQHPPTA